MQNNRPVAALAAVLFLASGCNQGGSRDDGGSNIVTPPTLLENYAEPPPPPPPPPPPNYAPAIEAALRIDDGAKVYGNRQGRVDAMRAIDLSQTPADFREIYLEHIFAWERRVRVQRGWDELTADDPGPILLGGIICAALNCAENPVDSRIEAEKRLREEMRLADEQVNATFRDVQRIAVRYGANPTVNASADTGTGNTTGM